MATDGNHCLDALAGIVRWLLGMNQRSLPRGTRVVLLSSCLGAMIAASPAGAEPAASVSAKKEAAPRLSISAGVTLTSLWLANEEMPETNGGTGKGLALDVAFYPISRLGIVAEAWWQSASFDDCYADASCFNYIGEDQTLLTAGLRLPLHPSFFLQGTAGAARLDTRYEDVLWAPVFIGLGAMRLPAGPVELGVDLRASTLREGGTSVTAFGAGASVGKSW